MEEIWKGIPISNIQNSISITELSGRFFPIERRDSRIYVFEDETWEVKGRFSQAVKDKTPLQ